MQWCVEGLGHLAELIYNGHQILFVGHILESFCHILLTLAPIDSDLKLPFKSLLELYGSLNLEIHLIYYQNIHKQKMIPFLIDNA